VKELTLLKNNPELVKSTAGSGVSLPILVAPDAPAMTLAPSPVLGPESLEKAQKQAKKEQNWLVEGYWRQVREHTRTDEQTGQGRAEWMKNTLGAETWLPKGRQNLQVSGDSLLDLEESRKPESGVPEFSKPADPLQPFLATWLSSRDYQILQKAGQVGGDKQPESVTLPGETALPKTSATSSENPYLKALNEGIQDSGQAVLAMGSGLPGTSAEPLSKPAAGAENPTLLAPISEPEKPVNPLSQKDEDRKYYPQLKRF